MKKIAYLVCFALVFFIVACATNVKSFDAPTEEPRSKNVTINNASNTNATASLYKPGMELVPWTRATVTFDRYPFSADVLYMVKIPDNNSSSIVSDGRRNVRQWTRELHLKSAENPVGEAVINLSRKDEVMYIGRGHGVPNGTKLYSIFILYPEDYHSVMNEMVNYIMEKHPSGKSIAEYAD